MFRFSKKVPDREKYSADLLEGVKSVLAKIRAAFGYNRLQSPSSQNAAPQRNDLTGLVQFNLNVLLITPNG